MARIPYGVRENRSPSVDMARLVNSFTRLAEHARRPSIHTVWSGTLNGSGGLLGMRYFAFAFVASALVACGGGEKAADSAAAAGGDTAAAAATPAGPVTSAAGTATPAPPTGTIHEVKMLGDDKGYRFEPAELTVKAGDGVKFVMVSGGPH